MKIGRVIIRSPFKKVRKDLDLTPEMSAAKRKDLLIVLPGEEFTVEEYLDNLKSQLEKDVFPLFDCSDGGAPFTVLRNTMCFVDHLSTLTGRPKAPQNVNMDKLISKLGVIDTYLNHNYKRYSKLLIQLYRHDLVHSIRPLPKRICVDDGRSRVPATSWFFLATSPLKTSFSKSLSSMKKKSLRKGRNHLRYTGDQIYIDTFSLFFDVVICIDDLIAELGSNPRVRQKIIKNYYTILQFSYSSLQGYTLDISNNKEVVIK